MVDVDELDLGAAQIRQAGGRGERKARAPDVRC